MSGNLPLSVIEADVEQQLSTSGCAGIDLTGGLVTPVDTGQPVALGQAFAQRLGFSLSASNAAGNGINDDTAAVSTFLSGLTSGARVLLPPGAFYLINSANLVVPPGVIIEGTGGYQFSLGGTGLSTMRTESTVGRQLLRPCRRTSMKRCGPRAIAASR
jgi:hypothetical protein